jgi:hypothetical protein
MHVLPAFSEQYGVWKHFPRPLQTGDKRDNVRSEKASPISLTPYMAKVLLHPRKTQHKSRMSWSVTVYLLLQSLFFLSAVSQPTCPMRPQIRPIPDIDTNPFIQEALDQIDDLLGNAVNDFPLPGLIATVVYDQQVISPPKIEGNFN